MQHNPVIAVLDGGRLSRAYVADPPRPPTVLVLTQEFDTPAAGAADVAHGYVAGTDQWVIDTAAIDPVTGDAARVGEKYVGDVLAAAGGLYPWRFPADVRPGPR
jgi:hypothetical protein